MATISLAVKYRPKTFDDLTEQECIKDILLNQVKTKTFQHAYLFTGPAGTGKTTSARIFADLINEGKGSPIEIDAASNSGVDNIRGVIDDSKKKPLDAEYKIFIIDECHSLSNGAWQAMLKLLEEPPKFSIFILCTTDPQKIPDTILSRVQRFQFNKISNSGIVLRLQDIIESEGILSKQYQLSAVEYIAKISNGGMRNAITLLDKCLSLTNNLSMTSVLEAIGSEDYGTFFDLTDSILNKDNKYITIIESVYNSGKDLKQFIKDYTKFILDCNKYRLFNDINYTTIPSTEENINRLSSYNPKDLYDVLTLFMGILNQIKWENDVLTIVEMYLLTFVERS